MQEGIMEPNNITLWMVDGVSQDGYTWLMLMVLFVIANYLRFVELWLSIPRKSIQAPRIQVTKEE